MASLPNDDETEDMGMADAMMMRGARLRELRAMMESAEQEEEEEEEGLPQDVVEELSDGRRLLKYDSYLAHQRYYDDLKHADYSFIDYGKFGHSDNLVVEQDKSLGKGGLCWDAAFILAEHLIENKLLDPNTSVLELGSGTGLCGLLLAKQEGSLRVRLTDLPPLLGLLQRNVEHNHLMDRVSARVLRWGCREDYDDTFHVVVGADVVASLYDPVALAETVWALASSTVYISYKGRLDDPHRRFEERLGQLFRTVQRTRPTSRNRNPHVYILQAQGKIPRANSDQKAF